MKAFWNHEVIAESDETVVVENNHYFLTQSVNPDYLVEITSVCNGKGTTNSYSL